MSYKFLLLAGVTGGLIMGLSAQAMAKSTINAHKAADAHNSIVHINAEQDVESSKAFIQGLADRGIGFLSNPDLTLEQRKAEFKSLLQDSFDMKTIGRFALGRNWNAATDAERKEYLALFEAMIIEVYSRRFGDYKGEALQVTTARGDGKSDVIVNSQIVPANGQKIALDWRVRKSANSFKVIDIIVEGVSMATTQRSEFSSIIQRGGGQMEVLLEHLRQN